MVASPSRPSIAAMREELERLVPACFEANREYCELDGIRTESTLEDDFGGPCSSADIRAIEKHAQLALPPSYRAADSASSRRTQWDALVKTAIDRATKLGQRDRAARWTALSARAYAVKLKTGR